MAKTSRDIIGGGRLNERVTPFSESNCPQDKWILQGRLFAHRFILRFAPPADSFFLSRRPLMLCNLSWLPPQHEGMRALRSVGALAAPRGRLYFSLSLISCREKRPAGFTGRRTISHFPVWQTRQLIRNFGTPRKFAPQRGKETESGNGNDTRGCVSILSVGRD